VKSSYKLIPTVSVAIVALIGIYRIRNLKGYEYLILLTLFLNIIVDLLALKMSVLFINNSFLYNLLTPIEILLTLIIYYQYLTTSKVKRLLAICIFLYFLFSFLNVIFIQDFYIEYANHSFFTGGILVCLFSYLVWLNDIKNDLLSKKNIVLWFAAANFIYYTSTIPIISAHNWLSFYFKEMAFSVYSLNLVMYGIWGIIIGMGFIWKRQAVI
jgi:hypothetical protein